MLQFPQHTPHKQCIVLLSDHHTLGILAKSLKLILELDNYYSKIIIDCNVI